MKSIVIVLMLVGCSLFATVQSACKSDCSCSSDCSVCEVSPYISILCLNGTRYQMGFNYGQVFQAKLQDILQTLRQYYLVEMSVTWPYVIEKADLFHQRYSRNYYAFLQGISDGSGIAFDDVKVINGMVTLAHYIYETKGIYETALPIGCLYGYVPPLMSSTGKAFHLRNYDFHKPFNQTSKHLAVTILHEPNTVPTAIVGIVGQIYCPTCINANGLFMELNNGMPSGGYMVPLDKKSLLIEMLEYMQNAETIQQLGKQLAATVSDYSLIINFGDDQYSATYEFSSVMGYEAYDNILNENFVITNYFLADAWGSRVPVPQDPSTWTGVTRRTNMLTLLNGVANHTVTSLKDAMDRPLSNGGARWEETVIQMVYDTSARVLHLRPSANSLEWQAIDLKKLFKI